jgi:hypothetical protein
MLLSKLSSVAEVFMPCPFDLLLLVADYAAHIAEFMRREADVLRYSHLAKPEFGAGAMATNVNVYGFARVALVREKEEFSGLPAKNDWHYPLPLVIARCWEF